MNSAQQEDIQRQKKMSHERFYKGFDMCRKCIMINDLALQFLHKNI